MNEIQVPKALKYMIETSNEKLKEYQKQLISDIHIANAEIMIVLGLNPEDGWILDMNDMVYRQQSIKREEETKHKEE